MKIAVIGPGSMGLLYGAKLSAVEDVVLIGNNEENIRAINECGVTIRRDGAEKLYRPKAMVGGQISEPRTLKIRERPRWTTSAERSFAPRPGRAGRRRRRR